MGEENKALINRWIETRNTNNLEAALALWTDDWQDRIRAAFSSITESFPDVQIIADEMLAEGNKVALRWTFKATHQGPFQGIPATGKAVTWRGIDIYTVTDGKLAGIERASDIGALLRQIGEE